MTIIDTGLKFPWARDKRDKTSKIILHHTDSVGQSVEDIHAFHRDKNGWNGIGYNYYVRQDGTVYLGRGKEYIGAHTGGENADSIGISFEGRYDASDNMPDAQVKAGGQLIAYLKGIYAGLHVGAHRDYNATACPGRYFRFDDVIAASKPSGDSPSGGSSSGGPEGGDGGTISADGLYRVQAGAFKEKANADKQAKAINAKGFPVLIKNEGGLYKIQCGAFSNKENAHALKAKLLSCGFDAVVLGGKSGAYALIDCDWLNVRQTPNGKIVGKANRDETYQVLGEESGWLRIQYKSGQAWIYKAYTQVSSY